MNSNDFLDVSGATHTYLINGAPPAAPWTGIARAGDKVRLRRIDGAASTYFTCAFPPSG